ncbi:DUF262 domain-containing protein [Mongoliitalea lutea]|uniref:GmrSD restriction endonucleases N-terminal domain-containing protein n=1 Tax=Mongoliitalea lutea TaxID=849756 RepID=A0A8J3CWF5_9BACT|nr:DUF262 domain-containing protein [Mongoliitalea lutea]GHB36227.1 hypothetical protein GCM10008106_16890 [Mongoliitalea lutea]
MAKKASAYLKEENLLTLLSQNNFIVPEIQREYVWGENEGVITKFLSDLKNKIGLCCNECNLPSSENKINIGFLYSYKPDYVKIEHDRFLDENLIDGQQRFTTLFLLLFYCALKETRSDGKNRKEEFLTLIRFEEKIRMCFDFRVRDLTKRFMLELIEKVDSIEQIQNIDKQTWFLKDYKNDVSIKSIRNALGFIQNIFSDNTRYFNHIINYVVFWHFKTEATSQGEELYITMNARGEELADNEVTKAALMVGGSEIYEWGKKWEEWQQFFWENRDKTNPNPSADKGFNGFLSCIAGLESYLNYDNWDNAEKDIQKLLTLEKVEKYITAFKLLIDKRSEFEKHYSYSDWIQKCFDKIWEIINKNETDWMVDYKDKNKSTERNRMVFIWSWLYYLIELKSESKEININELYRVLRFFFIRYSNNNRSVLTLKMTVNGIIHNGIFMSLYQAIDTAEISPEEETDTKLRTIEESVKYIFLSSIKEDIDFIQKEELIWQIEDHPLNLDGSDVGNINITHLIDLNDSTTIKKLTDVRDTFFELFPNGTKSGSPLLKTILLHYGDFWKDTSYYHKRYDFSDWKRNIRKVEFKTFIDSLIGKTLELRLNDLQNEFLTKHKTDIKNSVIALSAGYSLREKLIFYSFFISSEELWSQGERVIICDEIEYSRLFIDENQIIYNSKGNFKGDWGNLDLWEKVKEQVVNPLDELKRKIA